MKFDVASLSRRMRGAMRFSLIHFLGSVVLACISAAIVFFLWYPYPYDQLSGGRNLFLILICVDVVCGPLLTLIIYSPQKSRRELITDMSLVFLIQLFALIYGVHTSYEARPLFLVYEVDRFRVITAGSYGDVDVKKLFSSLPESLRPHWYAGPVVVGVRPPKDESERREVMVEAIAGGRDYAQRPDFYVPYGSVNVSVIRARAKSLKLFIDGNPGLEGVVASILKKNNISIDDAYFLPVIHRQEWIAVIDGSAQVLGFLPGDGFSAGR